ncbi:hypothetical protein HID58_042296 [Brassica napus]|uniref:Uncharacterized protein n=1 Tax=Brassica napus TaxID=3708 RepID=A0ABQ8BDK4_BRANA|nr:hypothetical protein HID58_042296 [Brassica napus]
MTMELVFIPSPGIGHLRSTVELAKQLVNGDERLSITVIIIPRSSGGDASDFAQISSFFTPSQDRLRHETISVADNPTGERLPTQVYIANQKPQVRDAVAKLLDPTGVNSPSPPRLAGFVIDMFCISMMDVADEFGVPTYMVYTSNAAFLGFSLHLQKMYDEKKLDTSELSESVNELEVPCFSRPYPVGCLPYIFVSKEWLPLFLAQARNFRKMKGILSLWFGVPMVTWPLYAEQKVNAFEMVEELGLAVEIRRFIKGDLLEGVMETVTAEDLERAITRVMEEDSDVRNKVNEVAEKCHVALMDGGSSKTALRKFIQDVVENVVV